MDWLPTSFHTDSMGLLLLLDNPEACVALPYVRIGKEDIGLDGRHAFITRQDVMEQLSRKESRVSAFRPRHSGKLMWSAAKGRTEDAPSLLEIHIPMSYYCLKLLASVPPTRYYTERWCIRHIRC